METSTQASCTRDIGPGTDGYTLGAILFGGQPGKGVPLGWQQQTELRLLRKEAEQLLGAKDG